MIALSIPAIPGHVCGLSRCCAVSEGEVRCFKPVLQRKHCECQSAKSFGVREVVEVVCSCEQRFREISWIGNSNMKREN